MASDNSDIELKCSKGENEMKGEKSRHKSEHKKYKALNATAYLCYNPGTAMYWIRAVLASCIFPSALLSRFCCILFLAFCFCI